MGDSPDGFGWVIFFCYHGTLPFGRNMNVNIETFFQRMKKQSLRDY